MERVIDVDMEMRVKKVETAFNRFFKKYPELDYWRDTFEYMADNNEDFFWDGIWADGTKNNNWGYALHLDIDDNFVYMAVIERR